MPLVIFNYYYADLAADVAALSGIESQVTHTRTLTLPREAMDASWTLVAVNANFNEDKTTDWQSLEVSLPELMTTETVLHSNVSVGTTPTPQDCFRFYGSLRQVSERATSGPTNEFLYRESSSYQVVSEYPNWRLGSLKLETPQITCRVTPRQGNVADAHENIQLNGVSIILSYEQ